MFILNFIEHFSSSCYLALYNYLDNLEISPYLILGYIIFNEVVGITCITIDFIIEDIIKPRKKMKMIRYEDF